MIMADRGDLERYLRLLAGTVPGERLLEIRYRRSVGMGQRFVPATDIAQTAALIRQLARRTDTYVGVLLRDRRAGGRDAVSRSHLVFAELDSVASEELLTRSPRPPSAVIASGTPGHLHAYWLLGEDVSAERAQEANRKLAVRVGGDLASVDASRILRAPESVNHKHHPPVQVRLVMLAQERTYDLEELTAGLTDPVVTDLPHRVRGPQTGLGEPPRRRLPADTAELDARLRAIPTGEYVLRLSGHEANREGKVICPFHDDRTPSLQCYPNGTWCCFGCNRGGSIYDFAAALWRLDTKGREFLRLRTRLSDAFNLANHRSCR